jgi:hypothetical protein
VLLGGSKPKVYGVKRLIFTLEIIENNTLKLPLWVLGDIYNRFRVLWNWFVLAIKR